MIFFFQPCPELIVELMKVLDFFVFEFGEEAVAHGTEALDFAFAFGAVGLAGDFTDAQLSADGIDLMGAEDLAIVDIQDLRDAAFQDSLLQGVFQMGQPLVPIELGMGNEAGKIVDQSYQVSSFFGFRPVGIGQIGAVYDVGLPSRSVGMIGMLGLKGAEGFL